MAKLIDGKKISGEIKDELKEKVAQLKEQGIEVTLAVIQVGNDPASTVYVGNKKKACAYIGIRSLAYELPGETTQEELLALIRELNDRKDVNGILVQLPLPAHIDEDTVIRTIAPEKDVDGFHPQSVGLLSIGQKGFVSCTPAGIIQLLKRSGVEIDGRECVVVGRSNIVGKPMAMLLIRVAIGKRQFITADYVKEGATVIDVGMHRKEDGKLCGDVDFDSVEPVAGAITPVPGGVGPMTIAMLMNNCVSSVE